MSLFIGDYVARGLKNVVQLSVSSREDVGGSEDQTETEAVIAEKADGGYVRLIATRVKRFGPNALRSSLTVNESPISEEEYAEQSRARTPLDLKSFIDAQVAAEELKTHRKATHKELLATGPRCPKHDLKMRLKEGRRGPFWGCSRYPSCMHTQDLTEHQRHLLTQPK